MRFASQVSLFAVASYCLLFAGCIYEAPITEKPTRRIDEKLLGDWTATNDKGETVKMKVVKEDDERYIVLFDHDLYRAWHSDVAGRPFFTVQELEAKTKKYSYSAWELKEDGTLIGRSVSDKVVPDETKDSKTVQELLKKSIKNPELFNEPMKFMREKQGLGG